MEVITIEIQDEELEGMVLGAAGCLHYLNYMTEFNS